MQQNSTCLVTMRIGSLFSGIGGLELGLEWAGLGKTVWQVERSAYCRSVLAMHWPTAKRYTDVRTARGSELAPVDLICGGFPCQDVSAAGLGAGLAGARSGLWYEFARLVEECGPRWVVVENVASGASRWVDAVRGDLGRLGYASFPIPLGAVDVGAPHRRNRIFIVAHTDRERVRDGAERMPWGRVRGVRRQGSSELSHDGGARDASDADSGRREGERLADEGGIGGARGRELDGRGGPRADGHGAARRPDDCWTPEPRVRGVDDGSASRLDRHRLAALGNSVVPQCAEVVGHVIRQLLEERAA